MARSLDRTRAKTLRGRERARDSPRRTFTWVDAGGMVLCAVLAVLLPLPIWIALFLVAVTVGPGRRWLSRWHGARNR